MWPYTNHFLGTQLRKSKGEDGADPDKAAGESYIFLSVGVLERPPVFCSLGLVFSSP